MKGAIGPMAQDLHAAFGYGEGETAISTVDADGIALAAILRIVSGRPGEGCPDRGAGSPLGRQNGVGSGQILLDKSPAHHRTFAKSRGKWGILARKGRTLTRELCISRESQVRR